MFGTLISRKKLCDPKAVMNAEKTLECVIHLYRQWIKAKQELSKEREETARVDHNNILLRQTQDKHEALIKDLKTKILRMEDL